MKLPITVLAASTALWSAEAAAQSPTQRDSIARFRDHVATIGDTVTLLTMEDSMIAIARVDRDNALLHVQLGFLAYRLGELTEGNAHFDDAAGEFEWAAEIEPEWPFAWYGLGLAELAMGEHSVIALENIRQILGRDYLSKAARAFAQAALVDPAFAQGVIELAGTAMQQRIRPRMEVALEALRQAGQTEAAAVPELLLARGRVERQIGSGDSAVAAFTRYLTAGGDSGVGHFELSRSLYLVGQPHRGEGAYFFGLRVGRSDSAVAIYRDDLAWLATDEELATFDTLRYEERAPWVRAFWSRRDIADVRAPGERLREHQRRYLHALERYALMSRHRRYSFENPFRTDQQVFDDRGVVYLRHGEPDRVATLSGPGVDPNESWLYGRRDGNLVFHFVARADVQDYKLVESLLDVLDPSYGLQVQAGAAPVTGTAQELLVSRQFLDPVYQRLAMGASVQQRTLTEERRMGERAVAVGTTTDSYPIRFASELDAAIQRYVVSGERPGETAVLLAFSVPGDQLAPEAWSDRIVYRLSVRVVVSVAGEPVALVDTLQTVTVDHVFGAEEFMHGHVAMPVPAGEYELQVVLTEPRRDAGRLAIVDELVVPDFESDRFQLSDIVVGRLGGGSPWIAGDDTVSVTARRRFPAPSRLQVYYEVHGLNPGDGYRSRLEVRKRGGGSVFGFFKRLFGGGGAPITLAFDGVASGPTTRILQTVDLEDLDRGSYRLRISVESPDGARSVDHEIDLELVGT
jgi:GWxTD domain-containing protein